MSRDPHALAQGAADTLRDFCGMDAFDIAIVLGSGWADVASALGNPVRTVSMKDIPGFTPPAAEGHGGKIVSLVRNGKRIAILVGRTHLYEGHSVDVVAHGVRVVAAAGCRAVILTNAAGSLREELAIGDPVLISDHINMTGTSPLVGARFVDMTEAYSLRLREVVRSVDPSLAEGVYAGVRGPQYETPAEIHMLRSFGADLVGMSTVMETVAAREAGMDVLGISLVTNVAAGLGPGGLDHAEVLDAGARSVGRLGELVAGVVDSLPRVS